jgi:small subunit ribosomal protein S1
MSTNESLSSRPETGDPTLADGEAITNSGDDSFSPDPPPEKNAGEGADASPGASTQSDASGSSEGEPTSAAESAGETSVSPSQVEPVATSEPGDVAESLAEDVSSASQGEVADQTPQDTPPAPETTSGETASKRPRRQLSLKPNIDPAAARAIPTIKISETPLVRASKSGAVSDEQSRNEAGVQEHSTKTSEVAPVTDSSTDSSQKPVEVEASSSVATVAENRPPVELPPTGETLDAQIEAEIEAALSSGELNVAGEADPQADAAAGELSEESLENGARLKGKIQSMRGDDVFLDVRHRCPAVVSVRQFSAGKRPEVGQLIEVVVDRVDLAEGLIQVNLPKGIRKVGGNWDSVSQGQIVDCVVTKTNKGGLEVTVSSLRGFLPSSQIDFSFVSNLDSYVGQKLRVQVLEANRKKRNLVVSRRAYLQIERKEAEEVLWKSLEVDQVFSGTIRTIKPYGAFVDIGGVDGFLHVGEISWSRIKHPSDLVAEGQQVEVKVIGLNAETKKISLGMRQLVENPWLNVQEKFATGSVIAGKVSRTADFGAFVELEPGIEGLVHISELDHRRVNKVTDVLSVGQEVDVKVLEVNAERQRISLSLKALQEKPAEQKEAGSRHEAETEVVKRKRKGPLKGGTGSASGSGLFGNPNDFS